MPNEVTIAYAITSWIVTVITIILGLAAGGKYLLKFKRKLTAIAKFLSSLDEALYDDKVTEEEFRDLFEKFKKIVEDT